MKSKYNKRGEKIGNKTKYSVQTGEKIEQKEWRKQILGILISKQMVDVNDIVSFVRSINQKYPAFKVADVIAMLIGKEKPAPLNTKLWKLKSVLFSQFSKFR